MHWASASGRPRSPAPPAGFAHPAVQLDADPADLADRWEALPELTVVNPLSEVSPGATVLLTGQRSEGGQQAVLAYQRYGRGTSIALTAQDTWLWQMHSDVSLEDQSHESFWKQMLRWLVDGVPDPVVAGAAQEEVEPGEAVQLTASVRDSTFLDVNDATVVATITSPSGMVQELPLEWTVEEDGEYAAPFRPTELGDYEIEIGAQRQGAPLGSDRIYVHAAPSDREFFGAARRTQLLQRIADDTGGQFYTRNNVSRLPEDLTISGAGVTLVDELDLWDMPALFLLMLLLMGAEWGYRRIRGLV
jgi:hypothetical protein